MLAALILKLSLSAFAAAPGLGLQSLLAPHVKTLDREMVAFRFVPEPPLGPAPLTREMVLSPDPNSTAYLGGENPELWAFKIRAGTRFLVADVKTLTVAESEQALSSARQLNCRDLTRRSYFVDLHFDEVVRAFANSESLACRRAVREASAALHIQATLKVAESVPLNGCRTTGSAILVHDTSILDLDRSNMYSAWRVREADPTLTPFIESLFDEGKEDLAAQSKLIGGVSWSRYRRGYGFFDEVADARGPSYFKWRAQTVLKCGPRWAIEDESAVRPPPDNVDWERQNLIVQAAISFNQLFRTSNFDWRKIRAFKNHPDYFGRAYVFTTLKRCQAIYVDHRATPDRVLRGPCGVQTDCSSGGVSGTCAP